MTASKGRYLFPGLLTLTLCLSLAIPMPDVAATGSPMPLNGEPPAQPISLSAIREETPMARANIAGDVVDGWFGSGVNVLFTVTDESGTSKGGGSGTAKPDGWLEGIGCNCDLVPGDQVHVTSDAGFDAVLVPITITGQIDVDADLITGEMAGGAFPGQGHMWVWSEARHDGRDVDLEIEADGTYAVDLSGEFDIWTGDRVEVWYFDANHNWLGTVLNTLRIEVNYGHDWVHIETEPLAEVQVTVAGKATLQGQADAGGRINTGELQDAWLPGPPDIAPGDSIAVSAAGYDATVDPVGTITGAVDITANTVAGTIHAGWFEEALYVRCEVWTENGPPGVETQAEPDGGSYTCDFGAMGWHLSPGQHVAVRYGEPDGDHVINVFQAPACTYLPLVLKAVGQP